MHTTGDVGDKLNDEEKPVEERMGSAEDQDIPHDSAGTFTTEEVLYT